MAATTPRVNRGASLEEKEIGTRAGFMRSDGRAIWHKYIIEHLETDHKGRAKFKKTLRPGDYWVYCITRRASGEWLLWNVKATVKFYENTEVTLIPENALN